MKILRKKDKDNKIQSGRSMIEILSVLVIIGILSIATFLGYKYAMEIYKYNETVREMELRRTVTKILAYTDFRGIVENPEGGNFFKVGYPVEVEIFNDMELKPFFSIMIKDVPSKQCIRLIESPWLSTAKVVELWIKNEKSEEDQVFSYKDFVNPNVCGNNINNDMRFFFYADEFLRSILWPCEQDSDCAMKCNTCEDGICVNKKNKVYYYGKCYIGNPCTEEADWDWVDNKCICKNGANYVFGQCVLDVCEKGAKWDAALQKCVCTDSNKEYDELTKTCVDKTCPIGESISYFYYADYPNTKTLYKKCCPNGRVAASILPNGTYHSTNGFCCPEGYIQKTGNIYVRTYCSLPLCEDDSLVPTPYQLQGATMYKCCPEGTEAATTTSTTSSVGGVCCQPGEISVEGKSGQSYCVPKECGPNEKRLQVLFPNAGGHNYGDFYIPICCPQTSEYAAMADSQEIEYKTGVCCKEGEIVQRTNGKSSCAPGRCLKEGEELVQYNVNYALKNKCCPIGHKAATSRLESATQTYQYSKTGICCEAGEKSIGADYRSWCIPNSCPPGKHLVPFKVYSQTGYMCCNNDVTAARWSEAEPACCQPGEIVNGSNWSSACVNVSCQSGEELQEFKLASSTTGKICCPAGQKAARYKSDSTQNSPSYKGVCCAKGESVFTTSNGDFCQRTTCSLMEHKLSYKIGSESFEKCCPKSSKAAAYINYDGSSKIAGVCCGENAIKVKEQCVACPVGKRPDESGTVCE